MAYFYTKKQEVYGLLPYFFVGALSVIVVDSAVGVVGLQNKIISYKSDFTKAVFVAIYKRDQKHWQCILCVDKSISIKIHKLKK